LQDKKIFYKSRIQSEPFIELLPSAWDTPIKNVQQMGKAFTASQDFWLQYDGEINKVMQICPFLNNSDKISVRQAKKTDCKLLWEWWNDSTTRQMMKDNQFVPWESHCNWFEKAIEDNNRMLCVGTIDSVPFGIVRFLYEGNGIFEVSINLDPQLRGKGYGSILLNKSIAMLKRTYSVTLLYAMLKKINYPSKRTFEKNGFNFFVPTIYYKKMDNFLPDEEFYCELNVGRQN